MKKEPAILRISRFSQAQRTDLIMIGQRMSNVCFNMKQQKDIPEDWRKICAELQERWDKAKEPTR